MRHHTHPPANGEATATAVPAQVPEDRSRTTDSEPNRLEYDGGDYVVSHPERYHVEWKGIRVTGR